MCYRFWKNGVQVDPLKEKLPEATPIDERLKSRYMETIASLKKQLDAVPYTNIQTEQTEVVNDTLKTQ